MIELDNSELIPVQEPPAIRGLPNMLGSELASWWTTKKWIGYAGVLTFLINFMVFLLFSIDIPGVAETDRIRQGMQFYAIFGFIASSVGIIIVTQDSVIGEKQTGTAAWVLSKPISRRSFILSKFISDLIGMAVTMIFIPGLVVYLQVGLLQGTWLSFGGMWLGMLLMLVNGLFFLTLSLLLGTLFNTRAPLLGISLGFLFGMQYITSIDANLIEYIPYPIGNPVLYDPLIVQAIFGDALWTTWPIVVCLVGAVIFLAGAMFRFDQEEF